MSAWAQTKSIAGARVSAWRRPRADLEQADHALVPAERHADLLGGRLDAEDQHARRLSTTPCRSDRSAPSSRVAQRRAQAARRRDDRQRSRGASTSSSVDELEAHDEVLAERRRDDVAPLDEHDAVELGQLAERQVGDLGQLVEAVEVGVVQRGRRRCRSCARA